VVLPARRVIHRRCVVVAARTAGLARKAISRRVPATTVGRDFVEAAADETAFHP
jgi:hypothetical protein